MTISSICLGMSLLFHSSLAQATPAADKIQTQEIVTPQKPLLHDSEEPTSAHAHESMSAHAHEGTSAPAADKTQSRKFTPSPKKPSLHDSKEPQILLLKENVGKYMTAWQEIDYKTMYGLESWEGGEKLGDMKYIQEFNADFKIYEWKITYIKRLEEDHYKVLVLVYHNPDQKFMMQIPKDKKADIPKDIKLRSTMRQWWKKQGDQFVRLFYKSRQSK